MILFGASGHAKVILDIIQKQGGTVPYMVDDNEQIKELMGVEVHTYSEELELQHEQVIVSIGVNYIRKKVVEKLNTDFGRAIHPMAVVNSYTDIGEGSVVMAGAIINSSTHIGNHTIINTASSVDHDCNVGNYTHISPGAAICGGVQIGEGTHIGAGAVVIPGITIGKWATIGAGAVVIKDIPDRAVVVGNPGKIIKYNDE